MNRNGLRLGIIALTGIALLSAPAAEAEDATVGQFVQRLAMAKGQTAADARTAVASLEAVGVALSDDLDFAKRLTEGDVVEIARAAGLSVTTSTAQRTFDEQQVRRFFVGFGPELGAAGRNHIDDDCPFAHYIGFTKAPFPGAGVPMSPFSNPFFNPGCGPGYNPFAKAKGDLIPAEPE